MNHTELRDDAAYDRVVACLNANHGNTLAFLDCMRACDVVPEDALPYREVEDFLARCSSFSLSTQSPHVLLKLLVEAGGIASIDVPETGEEPPAAGALPVGHLLYITEAGRAALAAFEPVKRFRELTAEEPEGYFDVYLRVLDACAGEEGASRAEVERLIDQDPVLFVPKRVYPGYFISNLETTGCLFWDGVWHTTDAGARMLDALAAR